MPKIVYALQAELESWRLGLSDIAPWLVCRVGQGQLEAHCSLCSTHSAPSVCSGMIKL